MRTFQKISDTDGGLVSALDPGDGFGSDVSGVGDLDNDGVPDIAVGAYADDDGGIDRGAVYVLFLAADGTVKAERKISTVSGDLTAPLDNDDWFGMSVAAIGDLNADGVVELAVGAPNDDDGHQSRQRLCVVPTS
ncbi:MAG: integrin alpha [Acidimicrobiales bacterium]